MENVQISSAWGKDPTYKPQMLGSRELATEGRGGSTIDRNSMGKRADSLSLDNSMLQAESLRVHAIHFDHTFW